DMAVGIAALLGYQLPRNFGPALLSRDLGEMWRLWHITLGTWFRDYVFAPLVKNRRDPGAIAGGLFITMTLIGFWHGADWKFIVWGSLQGMAMAYLTFTRLRNRREKKAKLPYIVALPLTFGFTTLASAFFRADDMRTAVGVLIADFSGSSGISSITIYPLLAFATLGLIHGGWHRYDFENRIVRIPGMWFAVGCGVALAVAFAFTPREIRPFVYFQF
ncbi:MAG: MBOAT family O-acyltransferase, partial [Mesorhizobium sp.]|nr:MBOAT family O-acyltransferase [Mesorhizobium sp.]